MKSKLLTPLNVIVVISCSFLFGAAEAARGCHTTRCETIDAAIVAACIDANIVPPCCNNTHIICNSDGSLTDIGTACNANLRTCPTS